MGPWVDRPRGRARSNRFPPSTASTRWPQTRPATSRPRRPARMRPPAGYLPPSSMPRPRPPTRSLRSPSPTPQPTTGRLGAGAGRLVRGGARTVQLHKVASDTAARRRGASSTAPARATAATASTPSRPTRPATSRPRRHPDGTTGVTADLTPPTSSASSPALTTSASFSVSYTAADNEGGSGLARVDLYAQAPGQSGYSLVASETAGGASGSFSYTATAGQGTYSFYTVATDKAGNVQAAPASPTPRPCSTPRRRPPMPAHRRSRTPPR